MSSEPSIVFFGTGPVSRQCLDGIAGHFDLEAIITKPDSVSPHGRTHPTPVKDWAGEHNIPLHQPADKSELAALVTPGHFTSRAGLVVDYGLIIPESVIATFPLGIINSHFSLLPEWRGADPITFALLSGQPVTGVSLMRIVPTLDEGDLLAQTEYPLPPGITISVLTQALGSLSNELLISKLPDYLDGILQPYPQDSSKPITYSRKLTKADGTIDWTKPAARLEREIRAYQGWPGSRTTLEDTEVTITAAHTSNTPREPLACPTSDGYLVIDRLKPAGKREMSSAEFLAGRANRKA